VGESQLRLEMRESTHRGSGNERLHDFEVERSGASPNGVWTESRVVESPGLVDWTRPGWLRWLLLACLAHVLLCVVVRAAALVGEVRERLDHERPVVEDAGDDHLGKAELVVGSEGNCCR
jgi:hypothetical protein